MVLQLAALLILCSVGCSREIAAKYTWKNILIGALLGGCVPLVLYALSLVFRSKKQEDKTEDKKEGDREN
jgi:hypothetical protein